MYGPPDYYDSDVSAHSDDLDYEDFQSSRSYTEKTIPVFSEADLKKQRLDDLYYGIISNSREKILGILDENNLDVNSEIRDGYTAIQLAASHGNPDIINELIKYKADVNKARDFVTPLMMACSCPDYTSPFEKSSEAVKLLIENGADVNALNRKRMNALMFAAGTGNFGAVKQLLQLTNKDALDNQRWNALFWAVKNEHFEIVEYLLENELDTEIVDVRGNTLVDIARNNNSEDILKLLTPCQENEENYGVEHVDFEDHFEAKVISGKPQFLSDIYGMLFGMRCESLINILKENNVTLLDFLSAGDEDLKKMRISLPFQRRRILTGLYKFHKQPYSPKSLHVIGLKEIYSNIDVAAQVLTAIKQLIAMESSLRFVEKFNFEGNIEDTRIIENIKKKVKATKAVTRKLRHRVKEWDKCIQPPDLITRKSLPSSFPWRKVIFSFSVFSIIVIVRRYN